MYIYISSYQLKVEMPSCLITRRVSIICVNIYVQDKVCDEIHLTVLWFCFFIKCYSYNLYCVYYQTKW